MEQLERARAFIRNVAWIFAKTYAEKAPHEYTLRHRCPDQLQEEFNWFVQYIRDNGYQEKFWKATYTYLNIDGLKYWTMGNPINETTVINRAK